MRWCFAVVVLLTLGACSSTPTPSSGPVATSAAGQIAPDEAISNQTLAVPASATTAPTDTPNPTRTPTPDPDCPAEFNVGRGLQIWRHDTTDPLDPVLFPLSVVATGTNCRSDRPPEGQPKPVPGMCWVICGEAGTGWAHGYDIDISQP